MYTDKYNYLYKCMYTHIIVHIILHIVDIHEKGINTHIKVYIHKYNCMYTHMSYMNNNYNYTLIVII